MVISLFVCFISKEYYRNTFQIFSPYTLLSETCAYSRINHILDNNVTVFFAICMAIWAALYLELWKRYSSNIVHRWGMSDFCRQSEHPRPAYIARIKHKRQTKNKMNPITRQPEPTLSFKSKIPSYLLSYSIIVLYVSAMITHKHEQND